MTPEPVIVFPEGPVLVADTQPILKRLTVATIDGGDPAPDANDAVTIDLGPAGVHYNTGVENLRRGEWAGSIEEFSKAIALFPEFSPAWNNRGVAREMSGDSDAALLDFFAALRVSPGNAAAWNNRGLQSMKHGDYGGAILAFDEAILLRPDYARARFHCGLARSCAGDLTGAIIEFELALQLNPADEGAKRELAALLG